MENIRTALDQVEVFRNLSEKERVSLADLASQRDIERGEIIAHYGETWPHLLVIRSGGVNVLKLSREGRHLGALKLERGDIFLTPSFFDGGPLPASLEVKESGSVYLWHREDVIDLLRDNNDVLWDVCLYLSGRIRQASEYVEELAFQPVHRRLARLLLDQFEEGEDAQVARQLTLDEMGTRIGTTPVMVCKILSRFAADGFIKVSRTEFEMLDRTALEAMTDR